MMTRAASSRQLEQVLQELKESKEVVSQLLLEREDNEREMLEVLNRNIMLKKDMAEMHDRFLLATNERDELQIIINGFSDCSEQYIEGLRRITFLEQELQEAHQHISSMESKQLDADNTQNQSLFDELVVSVPSLVSAAPSPISTVPIDLTNDVSSNNTSSQGIAKCSKNKFRKYIRINKFIKKTKKIIKNQKCVYKNMRCIRERRRLGDELDVYSMMIDNNLTDYDNNVKVLQSEICSLKEDLQCLADKYNTLMKENEEHTVALTGLLCTSDPVSSSNEYHSVKQSQCESSSLSALTVKSATNISISDTCAIETTSDNHVGDIVMFSDGIGKNMGQLLHTCLGGDSAIFTSVLYDTYSAPKGFCFDVLCDDTPIIDDPNSPDYNVDEKVDLFFSYVKTMSESYKTNNVLVTMGGDFTYMQAGMWYNNLDKLILSCICRYGNLKAAKDGLDMNLFYSTPDCYLKAVNEAEPMLPVKYDDFFPYASDPHAYWTGYYTSRPSIKYLETQTNVYLQLVKQLHVLAQLSDDYQPVIDDLKAAMGVMQHHNAVTGTEKQHVANDYVRMLTKAAAAAHAVPTAAFNKMMNVSGLGLEPLVFDRCMFNESSCATSENAAGNFIVTVYNPLTWSQLYPVHIPITDEADDYEVHDGEGNKYSTQIEDLPEPMLKIPQRKSKAKRELSFFAKPPPLGYKSYYITRIYNKSKRDLTSTKYEGISDIEAYWNNIKKPTIISKDIDLNTHLANNDNVKKNPDLEEFEKLFEDSNAGPKSLKYFVNPYNNMDDEEMRMLADDPMVVTRYLAEDFADQDLRKKYVGDRASVVVYTDIAYYPASDHPASGAYVFRPIGTSPISPGFVARHIVRGEIYYEKRIFKTENNYYSTRFYKTEDKSIMRPEFRYILNIDVEDGVGKEFVFHLRFLIERDLNTFFTDSNGRQMMERKINHRPDWNVTVDEPVAGNFYPTNVRATKIDDVNRNFTFYDVLFTDRAVGSWSFNDSVYVMLHRRLLHDDGVGVGESLNETVNGTGLVITGVIKNTAGLVHDDSDSVNFFAKISKHLRESRSLPQVFISDAKDLDYASWRGINTKWSWLVNGSLPHGLHLLTIERKGNQLLLRVENYLDKSDDLQLDLSDLLKGVHVKSIREATLSANRWIDDDVLLKWDAENLGTIARGDNFKAEVEHLNDFNDLTFSVKPKQIRTFVVDY